MGLALRRRGLAGLRAAGWVGGKAELHSLRENAALPSVLSPLRGPTQLVKGQQCFNQLVVCQVHPQNTKHLRSSSSGVGSLARELCPHRLRGKEGGRGANWRVPRSPRCTQWVEGVHPPLHGCPATPHPPKMENRVTGPLPVQQQHRGKAPSARTTQAGPPDGSFGETESQWYIL